MAVAWYIVPYVQEPATSGLLAQRSVAIRIDFPDQIGNWREVEVLGNRAIVKINTDVATLLKMNSKYKRILLSRLNDPISSLSAAQRTALRNELEDMGYTVQEIAAKLPNPIGTYTLRDALKFMATRRKKVAYDADTKTIVFTDIDVLCGDIDKLDLAVA